MQLTIYIPYVLIKVIKSQAFHPCEMSKNSNRMKFDESENSLSCMPSSIYKPLVVPSTASQKLCLATTICIT